MQAEQHQVTSSQNVGAEGTNILDIVLLFTKRWRMFAVLMLGLTLLGGVIAAVRPKKYVARVSFTTQSEQSSGGTFAFIARQQDPTVSLLKSDSIADYVVQSAKPQAFPERPPKNVTDMRLYYRGLVKSETKVTDSGDGLFEIQVTDPIPARGVAIANSFLLALQDLTFRMNAEGATITRKFFESQVAEARQQLAASEQELRDAQARTGLLQPGSQTGQELGQISTLRAQLVALQVQRATLSQSDTPENPEMARLAAQIAETQNRIAALSSKTHSSDESGIPTQNLELSRIERDVQERQAVVTSVLTQFERAQIQERFTAPRVRTVDRAELPLPRSSSHFLLISLIGAVLGFLIGTIVLVASEVRHRLITDPYNSERIQSIKSSLR